MDTQARVIDLRPAPLAHVADLVQRFHGYGACGRAATYVFAVYEDDQPVAGWIWLPPARGAALSVAPEAPEGVLALSRMVATPRAERRLRHISKPLRVIMRRLIDRSRWPALVTYSDEGQGHTGHVYKCSGWARTLRRERPVYEDAHGVRRSPLSGGRARAAELTRVGSTWIQRWEHHVRRGAADEVMRAAGWRREAIPGRVWASGRQAHRWVRS